MDIKEAWGIGNIHMEHTAMEHKACGLGSQTFCPHILKINK